MEQEGHFPPLADLFMTLLCTQRLKYVLLPTGSEERGVLELGSIAAAIPPSCQHMQTIALHLLYCEYSWVVKLRNTSQAILPKTVILIVAMWVLVSMIALGQYCGPHTAPSVYSYDREKSLFKHVNNCTLERTFLEKY